MDHPDNRPDPPTPAGGALPPPKRRRHQPVDLKVNQVQSLIQVLERAWESGRLRLSVEQYADVLLVLFPEEFGDWQAAEINSRIEAERMAKGNSTGKSKAA